ncbi:n-acetylmuramoyl-L-alanine amidase [Clostridium sp. CAG:590]|nr:n-acetylmuramoyl-L-alanine amidase [Clostridium sp. CAG:590]
MKKYVFIYSCFLLFLIAVFPFCHKLSKQVVALHRNKTTIVIDVGHGGSDPGKVGIQGIKEKDVNLAIARYLKDYLIAEDYTVYMTRETDQGLYDESVSNKKKSDLSNRIQFLQKKNASCMISIHQNSYPDTIQHGAQTFYYEGRDEDKNFAQYVQDSLLAFDPSNTRQIKSNTSYYILKNAQVPSILIECGFLSNPEETANLTDPNYQKQIAYAIAIGTCRYLR